MKTLGLPGVWSGPPTSRTVARLSGAQQWKAPTLLHSLQFPLVGRCVLAVAVAPGVVRLAFIMQYFQGMGMIQPAAAAGASFASPYAVGYPGLKDVLFWSANASLSYAPGVVSDLGGAWGTVGAPAKFGSQVTAGKGGAFDALINGTSSQIVSRFSNGITAPLKLTSAGQTSSLSLGWPGQIVAGINPIYGSVLEIKEFCSKWYYDGSWFAPDSTSPGSQAIHDSGYFATMSDIIELPISKPAKVVIVGGAVDVTQYFWLQSPKGPNDFPYPIFGMDGSKLPFYKMTSGCQLYLIGEYASTKIGDPCTSEYWIPGWKDQTVPITGPAVAAYKETAMTILVEEA